MPGILIAGVALVVLAGAVWQLRNAKPSGWTVAAAAMMTVVVFVGLSLLGTPGEWSWTSRAGTLVDDQARRDAIPGAIDRWHLALDSLFVVLYGLAALGAFRFVHERAESIARIDPARYDPIARRVARWSLGGLLYVLVGAAADLVENGLSGTIIENGRRSDPWLVAVTAAAWVKWLAVGAGIVALGVTVATVVVRHRDLARMGVEDSEPKWCAGRNCEPDEFAPAEGRIGVSLSGGGIRSAAFSLGALQAISTSALAPIRYITSVSGGGYMAAAWASLTRASAAEGNGQETFAVPFKPRSAEERWVRHHTDYLLANGGVVLGAAGALIGGLIVNLTILFVLVQVAAHPLGWIIGAAHPQLRANVPIVEIPVQPEVELGDVKQTDEAIIIDGPGTVDERAAVAYTVTMNVEAPEIKVAQTTDQLPARHESQHGWSVRDALIVEKPEGLVVAREPVLVRPPVTDGLQREDLRVSRQPKLSLRAAPRPSAAASEGSTLEGEHVKALLDIQQQPRLRQFTGTVGREDLTLPSWIWSVLGTFAVATGLSALGDRRWRQQSGLVSGAHQVTTSAAKLLALVVALLVLLPWIASELPAWIERVPGYDVAATGWRGLGAFLVAAASVIWRLRGRLTEKIPALERFRGRGYIFDAVLGIIVLGGVLFLFASVVDLAAANGPNGRLTGIHDRWARNIPDWARWVVATGALGVGLVIPVSAHSWSLYSFYRSRLAEAYMLIRKGDRVVPRRGDKLTDWGWGRPASHSAGGSHDSACSPPAGDQGQQRPLSQPLQGPRLIGLSIPPRDTDDKAGGDIGMIEEEWVVCTAVNIRGSGEAAPGRGAGSFSFSRSWVGGPEVGWIKTPEYLRKLTSDGRKRDVSVASTVIISGAAFSPAMGKMSKSWQGRVFALANLRLGVWVPNPMAVRRCRTFGRWRAPNAAWYLRELVGWFDRTAPYVYLTDGGHWENLGLVELLRRGAPTFGWSAPPATAANRSRRWPKPSPSPVRRSGSSSTIFPLRTSDRRPRSATVAQGGCCGTAKPHQRQQQPS